MVKSIDIPIVICIGAPTALQTNIAYYYKLIQPDINSYIACAQTKELFGKDPTSDYNKINNLYYLLTYIMVVAEQQQTDINNSIENPCSYYADNFICITNYFKCLNIDITPLLQIFGFNCINGASDGSQGIGVMEIDNNVNGKEFIIS